VIKRNAPSGSASLLALALALAVVHDAGVAHAQPKPRPARPLRAPKPEAPPPEPAGPPSLLESLTGDAKVDYEAARLLYGNGDHAGALVKFMAAYEKSKDPRLLWNVAACEKNLRHYSSLTAYLRRYLAEGQSVLSDAEKADAEALLKVILPLTASLELAVSEAGARVFIDDNPVGETPLTAPVVVDVGPRKLRIEKEGFEVYREELTIGDSPRIKLVAKLDRTVNDATLVVYTARPKDEIFIDGTLKGLGTWRGLVPSGTHTLRVSAPEMRSYQADVFLRDKETRTVAITLDREPAKASHGLPAWVWIGGAALVVAGGTVGGYFLLKPEDKQPDLPVGTLDPGSVQASFPRSTFSWR
jgi:PEGA domain